MARRTPLFFLSLFVGACAASTTSPGIEAGAGDREAGASTPDGSTAPPSPDAADGGPAAPFYPYAIGHKWTWRGKNENGREMTETAEVTGVLDIDGRHAFVLARTKTLGTNPPVAFTAYVAADGDNEWTRLSEQSATWEQSQKAPLADGSSWIVGTYTFAYKRESSQTVLAGTFDDCWRIMRRTSDLPEPISDSIVCRGVGRVREIFSAPGGTSETVELSEKNF